MTENIFVNPERPLPDQNNRLYAPYFEGLQNQQLNIQQCEQCCHTQMPPREFCFHCHSSALTWAPVAPRGTLYTYSIVYRAFDAWFKERTPYGIVVIELEEGNRILGNYFGEDVETLACGLPMEGYFEKVDESTTLLQWKKSVIFEG